MYKNILEMIVCPKCQGKLKLESEKQINGEVIDGMLACSNNHEWKIEEGVINFESKEQEKANNWSESYKEVDYDELDRKIKEKTPQIQLDAQEKAKKEIISLINKYQAKKVLDIATGRGILLIKLVKKFGNNIDLVCIDLSFDVLKYDRIKSMKINPDAKINYIACDASKLPFLRDMFDLSISFFGIQNMTDLTSKGVQEGVRVSKKGLINAGIVIKDDNSKIELLNKLLAEHGYDFKVDSVTESHFHQLHKIDESYKVKINNIFEGIGEENENDLIPIEGEWFAIAISETDMS
ncbi:class I SAM-dependent methyltransferase [Clostridium sp. D2Q-14]|uniref:class I SAM-dependent methyltransferase n=1 Tax=Anaeromonas gelatinilytica TaxID=2683194 RepID=UPI00193C1F47|nr:class I SAM-dependent methyltransferase [Anaeromonas gelatinilytica]MBS4535346.1 class I SAM-dependent methyltransferase [Anaeromonas gelatinilytica]